MTKNLENGKKTEGTGDFYVYQRQKDRRAKRFERMAAERICAMVYLRGQRAKKI
jgi:hypothetical protein